MAPFSLLFCTTGGRRGFLQQPFARGLNVCQLARGGYARARKTEFSGENYTRGAENLVLLFNSICKLPNQALPLELMPENFRELREIENYFKSKVELSFPFYLSSRVGPIFDPTELMERTLLFTINQVSYQIYMRNIIALNLLRISYWMDEATRYWKKLVRKCYSFD